MRDVRLVYKELKIKGTDVGNASIHKVYAKYGLDFRKVMGKNDTRLNELIKGD
jgi:hypothetical protein